MIEILRLEYPIGMIAGAFGLSRSGIYYLLNLQEGVMNKLERIQRKYGHLKYIFDNLCREFPKYGYRRIRVMLRKRENIRLSKKTVQWIMRAFNLSLSVKKKRASRLRTDMTEVTRPYELWQTDMTKIWVKGTGWVHLFAIIDCFTREITGWTFSMFASAREAIGALEMAVDEHFPKGIPESIRLTLNSDNGCQFGARAYISAVKAFGFRFTRTAYDTPEDNAYIESFFGKLKEEEVWIKEYESMTEAEQSINDWIHKYNNDRIHSSLNYLTPMEFREKWFREQARTAEKEQLFQTAEITS